MAVCEFRGVEKAIPCLVESTSVHNANGFVNHDPWSPRKVPLRESMRVFHADHRPSIEDLILEVQANKDVNESCTRGAATLMIRNIPCRCTEAEVLSALVGLGFVDIIEFFYLPLKTRRGQQKNFGYAFVGFPSAQIAETFRQTVDGRRIFQNRQSTKLISVSPAHAQGWLATVQRIESRSHMPLVSRDGSLVRTTLGVSGVDGQVGIMVV